MTESKVSEWHETILRIMKQFFGNNSWDHDSDSTGFPNQKMAPVIQTDNDGQCLMVK